MIVKKYFDLSDRDCGNNLDYENTRALAVIGVGSGCGCTHTSILCANYIKAMTGEKTALIEARGRSVGESIKEMCDVNEVNIDDNILEGLSYFEFYGVDYFSDITSAKMARLFNSNYRNIIIDCGNMKNGVGEEVLFAGRKIVVGSLMPWKCREYMEFCENNSMYLHNSDWYFYMRNGEKGDAIYFKDKYGIKIKSIPEFSNPYIIGKEEKRFFENEGRCFFVHTK